MEPSGPDTPDGTLASTAASPEASGSLAASAGNQPEWRDGATVQQQDPDPGYAATLALVDRTLSLRNELQIAKMEFAENDRQRKLGLMEGGDVQRQLDALHVQGLESRLAAVLVFVESEIQATQLELQQIQQELERLERRGAIDPSARLRQVRLAARLKVLEGVR